jgi:hypothetical protein
MLKLCTIHLAFDRGCYEAVLIENTSRTLGVNEEEVCDKKIDELLIMLTWN